MTTKQDKKPATFVNANLLRQFIEDRKTVDTFRIKGTNYYSSLYEAVLSFIAYLERNRKKEYSLSRYNQFAKRLEREFLRKEQKEKQFEIGENEALLKVNVINLEEEIECIQEIKMHLSNPKFLDIRERFEEWIFNTQPFNKVGMHTIKAKVEEVDCELYSSYMWDFEIIDFKPLD